MRIISKFHDYYDVLRGMDTDKNYIWKRDKSIFPISYIKKETDRVELGTELYRFSISNFIQTNGCSYTRNTQVVEQLDMFIVGFCGKIYFGAHHYQLRTPPYIIYGSKVFFEEYIDIICGEHHVENPNKNKSRYKWYKHDFENIFSEQNINEVSKIFADYKTPTFVIRYKSNVDKAMQLIINPCLKDYQFYKVFVPYNAYQEISMWVGNNMIDDKNKAWPIPDKLKAQSHGFDKHSFRKDKAVGKR